jgi:small ligand-binding sensory domain FIST
VTRIGIGHGNHAEAFALGRDVALGALRDGGLERADLLLAFGHGHVDLERFYAGLRTVVGEATLIVGGSSLGVITPSGVSYRGHPAAVAAIQSDGMRFSVSACGGLDTNEAAASAGMIDRLPLSDDDRVLLLFYDSVRVPMAADHPPVLNSSVPLLDGVEGRLAGRAPVIGAGLVGTYRFEPTFQFCGTHVARHHVVGCLVSGRVHAYYTVMHGCIPLDGVYRTITRVRGDVVYELDGRPIVEVVNELYGGTDWQRERPVVRNLTIGINHGPRFGPPVESGYVNRLITGVTPDGTGIGMFEADLHVGQEIQFMVRDNRMMLKSAAENVPALLQRIRADGRTARIGLYVSCGGRTAEYSATEEEEGGIVQGAMGAAGVPLLGFYSGVEVAPMLGRSRGLDWTGVLLILAED